MAYSFVIKPEGQSPSAIAIPGDASMDRQKRDVPVPFWVVICDADAVTDSTQTQKRQSFAQLGRYLSDPRETTFNHVPPARPVSAVDYQFG
jgi:hypothetical protein